MTFPMSRRSSLLELRALDADLVRDSRSHEAVRFGLRHAGQHRDIAQLVDGVLETHAFYGAAAVDIDDQQNAAAERVQFTGRVPRSI